jgi:acyl carrier protein
MTPMYQLLTDLLVQRFEVDRNGIEPDVTFEDLGLDSLFMIELLLIIESEFGIAVTAETATPRDTIGRASELIQQMAVES